MARFVAGMSATTSWSQTGISPNMQTEQALATSTQVSKCAVLLLQNPAVTDPANSTVRFHARNALAKMGSAAKEIVPVLVEAVKKLPRGSPAYFDVGQVLAQMGDVAVDPLEEMLKSNDLQLKSLAINALPETGDRGALALARPRNRAFWMTMTCAGLASTGLGSWSSGIYAALAGFPPPRQAVSAS